MPSEKNINEWIGMHNPEHVNNSTEDKVWQVVTSTWDKKGMRNDWARFFSNDKNVAPKTRKDCENDIAKWIAGNMET